MDGRISGLIGFLDGGDNGNGIGSPVWEKQRAERDLYTAFVLANGCGSAWCIGFEFLFRKFIIGFGENQLDLATTLQNFVDQAVAATLEREA